MNSIKIYECPKCHNRLLYSNKLLHDLKCTKERPAQFSLQNPTSSSSFDYGGYSVKSAPGSSRNISTKMSFTNEDGSIIEIKKDKNMAGKEELLEIRYDPQGNIIGRKRALSGNKKIKYNFHDMLDYTANYMPIDNYENIYVEQVPSEFSYNFVDVGQNETQNYNINYENNINNNIGFGVTNIQPIQQNFGNNYFSLISNDINNNLNNPNDVKVIKLSNNNYNNKIRNAYLASNTSNNIDINNNLNYYLNNYKYDYSNYNNINNNYYNKNIYVKKLTSNIDQGVPNNEFAKVIRLNNNNKIKNINMANPINYNPIGMVQSKNFYI